MPNEDWSGGTCSTSKGQACPEFACCNSHGIPGIDAAKIDVDHLGTYQLIGHIIEWVVGFNGLEWRGVHKDDYMVVAQVSLVKRGWFQIFFEELVLVSWDGQVVFGHARCRTQIDWDLKLSTFIRHNLYIPIPAVSRHYKFFTLILSCKDISNHTTQSISAILGEASIGIEDTHLPSTLNLTDNQQAIGANPKMRLTESNRLRTDVVFFLGREGVNWWAGVRHTEKLRLHDNEIVSGAMHLYKFSWLHP